jgi:hypothetical protein
MVPLAAEDRQRTVPIEPGKPTPNSSAASFHGKFRDECPNEHWFRSLAEARRTIEAWRDHYNEAGRVARSDIKHRGLLLALPEPPTMLSDQGLAP